MSVLEMKKEEEGWKRKGGGTQERKVRSAAK